MRQPTPTNVSPRPPSRSTRASGSSSLRTRGLVALLTLAVSGSVVSPVYAERGADSPAKATPPTEEQAAAETPSYPACEGAPGEGDVAAAKGAFQAGRTSFEEGDYERAILYWEDAFRRDCTAVKLLLNVGRAYELNGDLVRAVAALETYVARDTALEDRAAVERRIAKLKARVQQQQENAGQATNAGEQAEEAKQTKSEPSTGADDHQAARPVWPVVVTAAGVVGLAVGATFTALGQKAISEERQRIQHEVTLLDDNGEQVIDPETGDTIHCDRKGRNWDCPTKDMADDVADALDESDKYKRGKTQRAVGIGVASGGAALTIVGAYFWYTLWKHKPEAGARFFYPSVLPVVAPGYQGLALSGQF